MKRDGRHHHRVLHGSLFPVVLGQGLVLALGMASHALFNIVDLVLIGFLGDPASIAGVHVATTIHFIPMILGNGVTAATISILSRALGAGDMARAREFSSRSQLLMLALGLAMGGIGALLVVPSVELQGVTGRARDIGNHYLLVSQLGTVTMFVLMQTTATMRALGEAWMPFALLVGANVLNLGLDWVLLFGVEDLEIPAFGAPGAAYATVIGRGIAAVAGVLWLRRPGYPLRLTWVSLWGGRRGTAREILWLALPQSMQMLVRAFAIIGLTRIAGELGGQDAIVALGVTTRLDSMVLFSAAGFASAATAIAGRNVGAGRPARARRACRIAGLAAMALGMAMVAGFAMSAAPVMALFLPSTAAGAIAAGVEYLHVAALGQPFAAFCIAVSGGVNGGGRMVPPMLLDLLGYLGLLLPACILTAASFPGVTLRTIWWVFVVCNMCIALLYWRYLERGRWPYIKSLV